MPGHLPGAGNPYASGFGRLLVSEKRGGAVYKVRGLWDDGMGTSLVIMHTPKAEEIWQFVREDVRWFTCEK